MPTINQADAFVQAARTRLLTVASLPADRLWQNQRGQPTSGVVFVEDQMMRWDTESLEFGSSGLTADIEYGVAINVPIGQDIQTGVSQCHDVLAAFRASPLTVNGEAAELLQSRADPPRENGGWLALLVSLTFYHFYH